MLNRSENSLVDKRNIQTILEYVESFKDTVSVISTYSHKPKLTQEMIKLGTISRLFAIKKNDPALIYEITDSDSVNSEYYRIESVSWKVSGSLEDRYSGEILLEEGVRTHNSSSVSRISNPFVRKALSNYLDLTVHTI